jgi:hypothetical protein
MRSWVCNNCGNRNLQGGVRDENARWEVHLCGRCNQWRQRHKGRDPGSCGECKKVWERWEYYCNKNRWD